MSMLPPMSARWRVDIIWTDEDHIRVLINDRDVYSGDWAIVSFLKQLEELDYIVLSFYDDEAAYLNRAVS